jgi:hypothetical protein
MIIVVNHELTANVGIVRAHGEPGAFVSKLIVDRDTFEVVSVIQEMSVVSSRALNHTPLRSSMYDSFRIPIYVIVPLNGIKPLATMSGAA